MKKISLNKPILMGEHQIHCLELREPTAGDCRGISLIDLFQHMNPEAYMQLLPRITSPAITSAQVASLSLPDLAKVMQVMGEFFNEVAPKEAESHTM